MAPVLFDAAVLTETRSPGTNTNTAPSAPSAPSVPTSPPVVRYDGIVRDYSDHQHSRSQEGTLSPELSRLPPPRTPAASIRSRDTTSDYYTAVWGSPYEFSPSQTSRSARTAVSEFLASDDLDELSPGPSIDLGLEHLIPSRLADSGFARSALPTRARSRANSDHSQTPRSRTQRWVQLPQRDDQPERIHWWSDAEESVHSRSGSEEKRPRAPSSTRSAHLSEQKERRPGHNSRDGNRTLDQHSFWRTLRGPPSGDMSSLLESRWAATPEPSVEKQTQHDADDSSSNKGLISSRWADNTSDTPKENVAVVGSPKADIFRSKRADSTPEESKEDVAIAKQPKSEIFSSRWADSPEPDAVVEEVLPKLGAEVEVQTASMEASKQEQTQDQEQDQVHVQEPELKPAPVSTPAEPDTALKSSRWAATRESEEGQKVTEDNADGPPAEQETIPVNGASDKEDGARQDTQVEVQVSVADEDPNGDAEIAGNMQIEAEAAVLPKPTEKARPTTDSPIAYLEPPRFRKRISFRGKGIVINIPRIDFEAAGLLRPMDHAEIQERLNQFENAGYNIHGHDLLLEDALSNASAQGRDIYPDEGESRALPSRANLKVLLPDLEKWRAYTDWLTEQKLAALGVTLGFDEPAASPSPDMSRQSSNQYPPLPFSPPIPSASAGSMGRPGLIRGHSHTMSMAAPASPLNGPFGHMHRHSTVVGHGGFPGLQSPQQSLPGIPGLPPFSPQQQFGPPSFSRGGSPAQITALRQDLGNMRSPGSPLSQQFLPQSPQDYSRGMIEDQRRRQHVHSQSMYQPTMPNAFMSHGSSVRPTPALPDLPEDEDEEGELEEPEPAAYVPPHKRVQADTVIAVPTPRGHRHNISEGLERELLEAEQRQKDASREWIEVTDEEERPLPKQQHTNEITSSIAPKSTEKDPLGAEHPVQEATHVRKKSASRFNVAAPSFTFNPSANFKPGFDFQAAPPVQPQQSGFTFQAPMPSTNGQNLMNHSRHRSSGSFNAAAPSFQPASSDFSFSSRGPGSKTSETIKGDDQNIVDELPSIFGKVHIPDIVKPARRSKAVAIVHPEDSKISSAEEFEDEQGRAARGNAKRKQQRKVDDDGDQVPLFAVPAQGPLPAIPPAEKILGSNDKPAPTVDDIEADAGRALDAIPEKAEETIVAQVEEAHERHNSNHHGHKLSTSLSALAKPFEPPAASSSVRSANSNHFDSQPISDLEEGEIRDDDTLPVSPVHASERRSISASSQSNLALRSHGAPNYPFEQRDDEFTPPEPSFDEIDAVMRRLNADDVEAEPEKFVSPSRLPSPGSHPMKGVTYLAEWSRSNAPSLSPSRPQANHDHTDSGDRVVNGWPQVRQLNKAEEVPTSDWSGILSPPDEEKFEQRSHFFDSHIDSLISRVVEQRLQPLEESLKNIHSTFNKRNRSSDLKLQRTSSNIESDADDEDELSDVGKQRPISRGRDKRVDQIKAAVLEALREQSPQRSQAAIDIAELHAVLADMKVSFARAASTSLELDDVRAIVEDTFNRQNQAVVPVASNEHHEAHKRELSELEGRLNETLAGALEEANHRRSVEEREAEVRRQLRVVEEELQAFRENSRDEDSRSREREEERADLIERLERAEQAQRDAEDRLEDSEAGKDALHATLEEYRKSSNKWRQDIDEGKRIREELEQTLTEVERQNEEYHESSGDMKRRLQNLHSDMATAAGQLASEKAVWKSREEDYRAQIESLESQRQSANRERTQLEEDYRAKIENLEWQRQSASKERTQLEDELRVARAHVAEANEARRHFENMRTAHSSLDEMVRTLQAEVAEQQAVAIRYERQFFDAQESGRAEVHRTRVSLETEIEAANHQVNLVRAELEAELSKVRTELDNARIETETVRARQEHLLEEEEATRREALRKVNHSNSLALDDARHKYEAAIQDLTTQQTRAITHALEDKQRIEVFLNEKLDLSHAKLQHFQERVAHLEERLEVAKSAAQAAALNAKASKSVSPPKASSSIPEKVSPQALRESILVLQEQLQERELRIEQLQSDLEDGPAKLKERDTEISWLRELLAVRSEELTDLVNTISRPSFDRAAVRDTAIRIRANLDMEQQEKDRFGRASLSGQALTSLSNFATPKAAQLTTAFNKWRSTMESSALKSQARPGPPGRSYTPSKMPPRPQPHSYHSGLMTPPASNLRSSPNADEAKSLPAPRLHSPNESKNSGRGFSQSSRPRSRHASGTSGTSETPLFREQSYDRDAEDHGINMESFEDDDLDDVADSEPPAFRSLEVELDDSAVSTDTAD